MIAAYLGEGLSLHPLEFLLFWYDVPVRLNLFSASEVAPESDSAEKSTYNSNNVALSSVLFLPSVVSLATSRSVEMEFSLTEAGLTVLTLSATSRPVLLKVRSSDRAVIGAAGIKRGYHYS